MAHAQKWKRLGSGALLTQDADEGLGHILPQRTYLNTLLALLVFTVLTVYTAKYIHLGSMNIVLALLIASVKAAIVGMFFMHLKFESKLVIAYALYPLLILFLLIGGSFVDVAEREALALQNVKTSFPVVGADAGKVPTSAPH